jgi:hypothetical protein
MAFISNEIELNYGGKDYTIPLTMALVNKIESNGVNLFKLQIDLEAGGIPPLTLISTMYATMLQAAGAQVTADDVWVEINHGETMGVIQSARMAVMACFPKVPEKKSSKGGKGKS